MRARVSSWVAGAFVVALAATGCASSTSGPALGLGDEVAPASTASGPSGAASESSDGVVPTVEASAEAPVPATASPETSESPAQEQSLLAVAPAPTGYRIRDTGPGGGIVFYDAGSVQPWGRYLEAAPAEWNGGSTDPKSSWCDRFGEVATSTAIGAGAANTTAMLAACSSGAATTVRAYSGGGKTDWFLPSRDELGALHRQRWDIGGFTSGSYWSSSQFFYIAAYFEAFAYAYQDASYKSDTYYVRPVRAF